MIDRKSEVIDGGSGARKNDAGKARIDLIPPDVLLELGELYAKGAEKYDDRNYLGLEYHRLYSAMMRHALYWWSGEENDPVDGQHHLASVAWCAMSLREMTLRNTGNDDRPVPVMLPEAS